MDALDERVSFELPPTLVDVEAKQIAHQLWHEEHHDHHGPRPRRDRADRGAPQARRAAGAARAAAGRDRQQARDHRAPSQELQRALFAQARQYPGQERQFLEFVQKNPQALQQLRAPLFEEKVVDYILELAQVTEKPVSKDELQKAIEALDEEGDALAHPTPEAAG